MHITRSLMNQGSMSEILNGNFLSDLTNVFGGVFGDGVLSNPNLVTLPISVLHGILHIFCS
jgi:hypothetical protein